MTRMRKCVASLGLLFLLAAPALAGQTQTGSQTDWCRAMLREVKSLDTPEVSVSRGPIFQLFWLREHTPGEVRECFRRAHRPIPDWVSTELELAEKAREANAR